jgi:hypothetical protein
MARRNTDAFPIFKIVNKIILNKKKIILIYFPKDSEALTLVASDVPLILLLILVKIKEFF